MYCVSTVAQKYVLFGHVGFVLGIVKGIWYTIQDTTVHLSAIGAVLICCVWLWLSSIIRAPVTLLRLATAGPLLLFQLLTLPVMGYGLLDVTDCPVLLPQALLVFVKLPLHGSYLFQMAINKTGTHQQEVGLASLGLRDMYPDPVRISTVIDYLRAVGRVWKLPGHDLDLQDPKGELV